MTDENGVLIPDDVRLYLERLLIEAGIQPTNAELRTSMITELFGRVQHQIFLDLLAKLSDERLAEFEQLATSGAPESQISLFLQGAVLNSSDVVAQSLLDFKDTFLSSLA